MENGNLFTALSLAQGEMKAATKDTKGSEHLGGKKYADLSSCWEAIREPFAKHGLCVIQIPSADGPKVTVKTILAHKSGESVSGELTMTSEGSTPQKIGSAITYARRYGLCAIAGISPEDDDGAAASERQQQPATRQSKPPVSQPRSAEPKPDAKPLPSGVQEILAEMHDKFSSLEVFGKLKKELTRKLGVKDGEKAYYGTLGKHGVEHADEFKSLKPTHACAAELIEMVDALEGPPQV